MSNDDDFEILDESADPDVNPPAYSTSESPAYVTETIDYDDVPASQPNNPLARAVGNASKLPEWSFVQLLGALGITSVFQLIASASFCDHGCSSQLKFGVSAGALSFVGVIAYMVYFKQTNGDESLQPIVATIFFLWWLTAVCLTTFTGACSIVSNCWLATWTSFGLSALLAVQNVSVVSGIYSKLVSACTPSANDQQMSEDGSVLFDSRKAELRRYYALAFLASLFVTVSVIPQLADGAVEGYEVWILITGLASSAVYGILSVGTCERNSYMFVYGMALLWIVSLPVATTAGPFLHASNGWFACWATAGFTLLAASLQ